MSGKELAKLLEQNEWVLLRIQGSHHIYGKPGIASRISVPIHGSKDLKIGLLRKLMKTAGLLETSSSDLTSEQPPNQIIDSSLDIDDVKYSDDL